MPLKNSEGAIFQMCFSNDHHSNLSLCIGGSTHIVLTVDPDSGQSVKQFLQTQVDPTTGEITQKLHPISSGSVASQHDQCKSYLVCFDVHDLFTQNSTFQAMNHLKSLRPLTHLQAKPYHKLYKIKLILQQEKQCRPLFQYLPPL